MKKVLIVDDSMYTRSLILDMLSDQDYEIRQAADSNEMFSIVDEFHPDIVMIDLVMPGTNGLDAIKILHEKKPDIKIIVCSAQGIQAIKDEAFANGALGYVQKPISVESLTSELNRVLGL